MNSNAADMGTTMEQQHWADYSSGIAWGTVVLFLVVAIGYVSLISGVVLGEVSLPAGMLIATLIIYLGFTVSHEAGHGNIAHGVAWMKPFERMMGWSAHLLFLILPFGLFAKIHDYHHAFTNDPERDPDHWVSGDTWWEASWRAVTLSLNYLYLAATRFKNDPVITQTHRSSLVYYSITLPIVVGLIWSGFIWELLMIGILPIFLASFVLGMLFDWIPHKPSNQQGRYQNTRSYLFPGLKLLTLGQNYHHIHHLYPRVTWYHYQRVFNLIRPELEAKNAPIEVLFSNSEPRFGQSKFALQPSSIDGIHKQTLKVKRIEQVTDQAVTITFENTNGKTLPFSAGQYITITKMLSGDAVTRCYSICSAPKSGELSIGVKRVEGGRLSTYLNSHIKEGDELTVAGPFGDFVFESSDRKSSEIESSANVGRPLVLIAGGSGITPILSIAKAALKNSDNQQVNLIYANRSLKDTMFVDQLNELQRHYSDRLSLVYVFQQADKDWNGYSGYLDHQKLEAIFTAFNNFTDSLFYICGPNVMKEIVVETLQRFNLPSDRIFIEEFSQKVIEPKGEIHQVKIEFANGMVHELAVAENQTILQVANSEGVKIPSACGVGQCGCCMMQVVAGESVLATDETPGLLQAEKEKGLTLACQCQPRSSLVLNEGGNR